MTDKRPQDEVRATPIAIVGIVGAILLFAFIVGLSAVFLHAQQAEMKAKDSSSAPDELRRLTNQQLESLNEYRWVDEKNGIVRIPIDRAMELMVKEAAAARNSGSGR